MGERAPAPRSARGCAALAFSAAAADAAAPANAPRTPLPRARGGGEPAVAEPPAEEERPGVGWAAGPVLGGPCRRWALWDSGPEPVCRLCGAPDFPFFHRLRSSRVQPRGICAGSSLTLFPRCLVCGLEPSEFAALLPPTPQNSNWWPVKVVRNLGEHPKGSP
jgi:hypothetical protein